MSLSSFKFSNILSKTLHNDSNFTKNICIYDSPKKYTETCKSYLNESSWLLINSSKHLTSYINRIYVLSRNVRVVNLIPIICALILWEYPDFWFLNHVPPSACKAVNINYDKEHKLHQVHKLFDVLNHI